MNTKSKNVGIASNLARFFAAAALVLGVTASQQAGAALTGIAATKHNLGTGQATSGNNKFGGTDEICVFCHTPHGSNTGVAAPLWNKTLGTAATSGTGGTSNYKTYNSNPSTATSTLMGTVAPVGSVSLACLSCHDGTQAMDNMINKPGSGYAGTMAAGSWTGNDVDNTTGKLLTSVVTNLGGTSGDDLTNDHPIGMPYCGGYAAGGSYTDSYGCLNPDFKAARKVGTKWFVDTNGDGAKQKTDMTLYDRGDAVPRVECASCHDPHVEAKASTEVSFLRVSQANSGVCLSCHTK